MTMITTDSTPTAFVIETGVPIPASKRGRPHGCGPVTNALRALMTADIGASVFLPGVRQSNVGGRIRFAGNSATGWASSRNEGNGVRVWKIAEPIPAVKK